MSDDDDVDVDFWEIHIPTTPEEDRHFLGCVSFVLVIVLLAFVVYVFALLLL